MDLISLVVLEYFAGSTTPAVVVQVRRLTDTCTTGVDMLTFSEGAEERGNIVSIKR